jgi:riboflavin kinase / FMN adenylyltransferase
VNIVRGFDESTPSVDRSVVLIGNFDGLHRGHQQLLTQGGLLAAQDRAALIVLTFDPHPMSLIAPEKVPERLMTLADKLDLLEQYGVSTAVVAESTPELLHLEPERFIDLVVDRFSPKHIVEGSTFGFGRHRRGTPEMLRELGTKHGYQACIIDPVQLQIDRDEVVTVSSSVIRKLIRDGNVGRAALCLGRPYSIAGRVVSGEGRGTGLGFPTANVGDVEQLLPADGVYAGSALVAPQPDGEPLRCIAAISVGTNPTFGGSSRRIEAHLIDLDEGDHNFCEARIHVEFAVWLRSQKKFDSPESLSRQIAADVEAVRSYGGRAPWTSFPTSQPNAGSANL